LFALTVASCAVTLYAQHKGGAVKSLDQMPWTVRVLNALAAYAGYLGKTFWPRDLALFYPHPGASLPLAHALGAGLLLAVVSLVVLRERRRHPYLAVGWLWFLGTLVPVIGLVQVGEQALADRYTYVSLVGVFILFAWGVPALLDSWGIRPHVLAIPAALLL